MKRILLLELLIVVALTINAQGTVTDCQGHTYPVVKIGNQYWMAENLQCTKYDTQSERAGGDTLQTASTEAFVNFLLLPLGVKPRDCVYEPSYTEGRNETSEYGGSLTNAQRQHLGLLYNWSAAMGYTAFEAQKQTGSYSSRRQGICPNGWHLPSRAEWKILVNALGGVSKLDSDGHIYYSNVGAKLKSKNGWYNGGNGTDDYGFCGLPAGYVEGGVVKEVGGFVFFWSSDSEGGESAYGLLLNFSNSDIDELDIHKSDAHSVRCVKNGDVIKVQEYDVVFDSTAVVVDDTLFAR